MTKDQILTEAMNLDARDRDELAETLWQSLTPGEMSADQLTEIRRRVEMLDRGQAQAIPGSLVMRELRQRLAR